MLQGICRFLLILFYLTLFEVALDYSCAIFGMALAIRAFDELERTKWQRLPAATLEA